jgi:N-acetylglucosaminyldiphosphoundecaprenol N-acetyl-beta-D-mannosaminyltransferase
VGSFSPPFRALTAQEDEEVIRLINDADPDIVWVGLSTPKQERWMAAHRDRLRASVLLGVGAAFDFHAGLKRQAPRWMQRSGLEWFFRLATEPRRLWRRYLLNNPRFVWSLLRHWIGTHADRPRTHHSWTDPSKLGSRFILGVRTDSPSYSGAAAKVLAWANTPQSRYVCVSNVHVTMESYDSREYRAIVNAADLVTPDGMPLVWALRLFGVARATRVYGPTLTENVLQRAANAGVAVGFYGGSEEVLTRMLESCRRRLPNLQVAFAHAPPFRPLTAEEDAAVVEEINRSGARILFVGLGCPKQERWMALHKGRINAVMLGVGAAFDFLSGMKPQAPPWMQQAGLEWLFRLATEPRRLWRRYAYHNPRFVVLLAGQYLRSLIA